MLPLLSLTRGEAAQPALSPDKLCVSLRKWSTPTPPKPKPKATDADRAQYRLEAKASRLSVRAAQQMIQLRQSLDQDPGGKERTLLLAFDGGYTNSTVLKQIPPHTVC